MAAQEALTDEYDPIALVPPPLTDHQGDVVGDDPQGGKTDLYQSTRVRADPRAISDGDACIGDPSQSPDARQYAEA